MDVTIEGIDTKLGSKGVVFRVAKPKGGAVGRLEVGKAKLRWFKGNAHANCYEASITDFIVWLESRPVSKV